MTIAERDDDRRRLAAMTIAGWLSTMSIAAG
jgi:hypothetical protein